MSKRFKLKRKIQKSDVVSMVTIGLLLVLFVFLGVEYMRSFGDLSDGMEAMALNMKEMINSYGGAGVFVFLLLHMLHVIVSAIPASLVQFVGGVIYGTFWGVVTSEVGIFLGSIVAFNLSRIFGKRIVSLFASQKTIDKIGKIVAGNTSSLVLLAMFIMPGFPKDFLPYAVGLTDYKAGRFYLISAVGRLPSIIVSTYLGAHIVDGNKTAVIIVTVITCVIFLLLYLFRNKIFALISGTGKK